MVENISNLLREIGFSNNEIKIYLDLIQNGESEIKDIAKRTDLHRPNVYDTIEKLVSRKIILVKFKDKDKLFYPQNPEILLTIYKEREKSTQNIVKDLLSMYNSSNSKSDVVLIEGTELVKKFMIESLKDKGEIRILGNMHVFQDSLGKEFMDSFEKERIKNKINMKVICFRDSQICKKLNCNKCEELKNRPYTSMKLISESTLFNKKGMTSLIITENKVIIFIEKENAENIVINNDHFSFDLRNIFDFLWNLKI